MTPVLGKRTRLVDNSPGILSSVKKIFSGLIAPSVGNLTPSRGNSMFHVPRAKIVDYESGSESEEESASKGEEEKKEKKKSKNKEKHDKDASSSEKEESSSEEAKKEKKRRKKEAKAAKKREKEEKQKNHVDPSSSTPTSTPLHQDQSELVEKIQKKLKKGVSVQEYQQLMQILQANAPSSTPSSSRIMAPPYPQPPYGGVVPPTGYQGMPIMFYPHPPSTSRRPRRKSRRKSRRPDTPRYHANDDYAHYGRRQQKLDNEGYHADQGPPRKKRYDGPMSPAGTLYSSRAISDVLDSLEEFTHNSSDISTRDVEEVNELLSSVVGKLNSFTQKRPRTAHGNTPTPKRRKKQLDPSLSPRVSAVSSLHSEKDIFVSPASPAPPVDSFATPPVSPATLEPIKKSKDLPSKLPSASSSVDQFGFSGFSSSPSPSGAAEPAPAPLVASTSFSPSTPPTVEKQKEFAAPAPSFLALAPAPASAPASASAPAPASASAPASAPAPSFLALAPAPASASALTSESTTGGIDQEGTFSFMNKGGSNEGSKGGPEEGSSSKETATTPAFGFGATPVSDVTSNNMFSFPAASEIPAEEKKEKVTVDNPSGFSMGAGSNTSFSFDSFAPKKEENKEKEIPAPAVSSSQFKFPSSTTSNDSSSSIPASLAGVESKSSNDNPFSFSSEDKTKTILPASLAPTDVITFPVTGESNISFANTPTPATATKEAETKESVPSGGFTFGITPSVAPSSTLTTFGSIAPSGDKSGFGTSNPFSTTKENQTPVIGSTPAFPPSTGGFNFGGSSTPSESANPSAPAPTFSFGKTSNPFGTGSSTSGSTFVFGSTPQPIAVSDTFKQSQNSGGSMFSAAPPSQFSFGAQSQAPVQNFSFGTPTPTGSVGSKKKKKRNLE